MLQKNKIDQIDALTRMQKYCALQERAPYDVDLKLRQFGLNLEQRSQIIADLIEQDFLSEERFALAYASGKFKMNKWGRIKIQQGLFQKFVSKYNIQKALNSLSTEDYQEQLKQLLHKYCSRNKLDPGDWNDRQKILRYGIQKGYEVDFINRQLEQM